MLKVGSILLILMSLFNTVGQFFHIVLLWDVLFPIKEIIYSRYKILCVILYRMIWIGGSLIHNRCYMLCSILLPYYPRWNHSNMPPEVTTKWGLWPMMNTTAAVNRLFIESPRNMVVLNWYRYIRQFDFYLLKYL